MTDSELINLCAVAKLASVLKVEPFRKEMLKEVNAALKDAPDKIEKARELWTGSSSLAAEADSAYQGVYAAAAKHFESKMKSWQRVQAAKMEKEPDETE